jgi:DNA-binding LacI/PurR family transcriptional regulator
VGTVSRVLNDSPRVSHATHARVRTAIDELGYRRNRRARNLSLGRSQAIGVVAPFFTSPSVVERLRGVSHRLAGGAYDLVLFDVETPRQRADAFSRFASRDRIDGLLVISLPLVPGEVEAVQADDIEVVLVDVAVGDLPHVVIDDREGGRLAAEHLLERGHRRLGFIGDDARNPFGFTSSERRRAGFMDALDAAGICAEDVTEALGLHGRLQARALAEALLGLERPPTAIFAASDVQAIGVLEAAAAAGLRVPEDVAVLGFDDIEVSGALGLSTVRQPLFDTGARGAEMLVAAVERRRATTANGLEPLSVVARRTT